VDAFIADALFYGASVRARQVTVGADSPRSGLFEEPRTLTLAVGTDSLDQISK
jgi:hypothetical protein